MNKKGFTLIEILIVVMVIGILSGIMLQVINVGDIRKKTRDSQRITDLKKIQTALELYFVDNRIYPVSGNWTDITGSDVISTTLKGSGNNDRYINQLPTDPMAERGNYKYKSTTGGIYYLVALMELEDNFEDSPCSENPYSVDEGCYEVQNPL